MVADEAKQWFDYDSCLFSMQLVRHPEFLPSFYQIMMAGEDSGSRFSCSST
jgi:hypothetical protein